MKTFTPIEFKMHSAKANSFKSTKAINNDDRLGCYMELLFNKDNLARRTDVIFIGIDKINNTYIIEQVG